MVFRSNFVLKYVEHVESTVAKSAAFKQWIEETNVEYGEHTKSVCKGLEDNGVLAEAADDLMNERRPPILSCYCDVEYRARMSYT